MGQNEAILDQNDDPLEQTNRSLRNGNIDNRKTNGSGDIGSEDQISLLLLLLLYTLQGIPMGLCGSIPLLMKERGATYSQLAVFSLVTVPFSLKLLWAPIVDSLYLASMGRRKTWLVPVQLLCGAVMVSGSPYVAVWLGDGDNDNDYSEMNVNALTIYFTSLYFLMATQDISVDGWALTMLSRSNVGLASTVNSIGQSLGYFIANQGFIALSDVRWCARFLHPFVSENKAMVSLGGFMNFWGYIFIVTTFVVWIFKSEVDHNEDENDNNSERIKSRSKVDAMETGTSAVIASDNKIVTGNSYSSGSSSDTGETQSESIRETYQHIGAVFRLRPVFELCIVLLTCKLAFAPTDSSYIFKLQEYGMPKADIATVSPVMLGVGLVLPAFLGPYVRKSPLDIFLLGIPLKMATSLLSWYMFQFASRSYANGMTPGPMFFCPLVATMLLHEMAGTTIFVAQMAFFAQISDPTIGGTYMTMLNTVANLGSKWPNATALWLMSKLTWETCETLDGQKKGIVCTTLLDGYTVETMLCLAAGLIWLSVLGPIVKNLKHLDRSEWLVSMASLHKTN